ncbi:ABC transporter substrate-binding protein [Aureimonas fodinaquatilis]|uniref:ABC transporter substrate-binding protein n=1 Tax=Aureimonas fodinaquatilis TaxID=2565783 RepID=A0A5B0E1H3_9HYPH|nr:ABC transporter substrate-binding protein [Aureimonas fodinaquatilis]KAA0972152.1 ABC transporter substrate-binding protein [Aureimonas fodinaquatilis]
MGLTDLTRRSLMSVALLATMTGMALPAFAQEAPIKLGLLAPFSGSGGPYGKEEEDAARAAVKIINEAGGVLGRQLELIVADDETQPTAGVAAARKLIDVDGVVSISGIWSSAVALAVKPIAIEKGVLLTTNGSADEITQGDNQNLVWRFQTNGKDWGDAFGKAFLNDDVKTASVLVLQTPFTLSTIQPFKETFTAGGGEILQEIPFNPNQPSYRVEVDKILEGDPEAIFVAAYVNELSAVVKEAYRNGYEGTIYAYGNAAGSNGQFVANVGKELAEGVHHTQHVPVENSESYALYLNSIGQPEGTVMSFGAQVFDQIVLTALAIEKTGSTKGADLGAAFPELVNSDAPSIGDPVKALEALRAGEPFRYSGAASDFRFEANGDQSNLAYGHFVIKDGESELVDVIR